MTESSADHPLSRKRARARPQVTERTIRITAGMDFMPPPKEKGKTAGFCSYCSRFRRKGHPSVPGKISWERFHEKIPAQKAFSTGRHPVEYRKKRQEKGEKQTHGQPAEEEWKGLNTLIKGLLDEGPVPGISQLDNAETVLLRFLELAPGIL